jgi:hypothetical protein
MRQARQSVRMQVASLDRAVKQEVLKEEPPSHADQELQGTFNGQKGVKSTTALNVAALGTMYTIKKHVPKRAPPAGYRSLDELPGALLCDPLFRLLYQLNCSRR